MFDLEQAISEWRQQMISTGMRRREVLDELETHLRDDVEQQTRAGLAAQEAFARAVDRIGQAGTLRLEFAKIDESIWAARRRWKAAIIALTASLGAACVAWAFINAEQNLVGKI